MNLVKAQLKKGGKEKQDTFAIGHCSTVAGSTIHLAQTEKKSGERPGLGIHRPTGQGKSTICSYTKKKNFKHGKTSSQAGVVSGET